ncbi:hypothetical protein [Brevibacillus nitrificans]|nr:hypothetical protein [Brevibacillus nitrificans]
MEQFVLELILEAKITGLHTGWKNIMVLARRKGVILAESSIRKLVDRLRERTGPCANRTSRLPGDGEGV